MPLTNAEKAAAFKDRMNARGLVQTSVWVPAQAEAKEKLKKYVAKLQREFAKNG